MQHTHTHTSHTTLHTDRYIAFLGLLAAALFVAATFGISVLLLVTTTTNLLLLALHRPLCATLLPARSHWLQPVPHRHLLHRLIALYMTWLTFHLHCSHWRTCLLLPAHTVPCGLLPWPAPTCRRLTSATSLAPSSTLADARAFVRCITSAPPTRISDSTLLWFMNIDNGRSGSLTVSGQNHKRFYSRCLRALPAIDPFLRPSAHIGQHCRQHSHLPASFSAPHSHCCTCHAAVPPHCAYHQTSVCLCPWREEKLFTSDWIFIVATDLFCHTLGHTPATNRTPHTLPRHHTYNPDAGHVGLPAYCPLLLPLCADH